MFHISRKAWPILIALILSAACTVPTTLEGLWRLGDQDTPEPATNTPVPTPTPLPPPELIVFSSNGHNLFTIDPFTGEIVQLTEGFSYAVHPVWSRARVMIAFFGVLSQGGTWPAGKYAAPATRFGQDEDFHVFTIGADGKDLAQVTDFTSAEPDWFPDGQRLVFNSDQTEPPDVPDLYAMNLDGSDLVQIIDSDSTADYHGKVSPDGNRLLFISERTGNPEIFVANIDGSGVTQLTDTPEEEYSANWSPDGSQILFDSRRSGNDDVWVMKADGSNPVQLTTDPGLDGQCAWSPDGSQIVFVSNRSGAIDLWIMNADGSDPMQLTDNEDLELFPDW